jgi:hypothetical protein
MRLLYLVFILLFTSCGVGFQYTTLNHAGHIDGIYSSNNPKVNTINSFSDLQWKLRTDFNFRYDFAQYALSQPRSFDWNNRILGNRYNWFHPYLGYNYYWNRDQMWNDWVWGYPLNYGIGYTYSWRNRRWFSNQWGWNNYYGWNNRFYNRYRSTNVAYHTGRRGNTRTINRRTVNNNRVVTTPRTRTIIKNKPRVNPPIPRFKTPSRQPLTIKTTPRTSTRSNNTRTVRSNSRRKN